jgi:hypothetical protein
MSCGRFARAAGAACLLLAPGPGWAQQSLMLDGRAYRLPEGVETGLAVAPASPGGEPGGDAVEFRWPDGRSAALALVRPDEPYAELPPASAVGRFDANGIAPVDAAWAAGRGRSAGSGGAPAGPDRRSYVVRTGNPAYPLARVVCEGRAPAAACRLFSRVGETSVLTAPLPSTDPAAVAAGVATAAALIFEP